MSGAPIIDLHVARFVRDGVSILEDLRWTVRAGEHWAVLGSNGSGKTSLLSIVAGHEWPSEGWVAVLGERYGACDMPSLKRRIGFVGAGLARRVPSHQRAEEVAASGLSGSIGNWRPWTADELARGRDALGRMGAGGLGGRAFGVLSEGEKQRTVIARALVREPALLVLDEPCAGLDPAARERLLLALGEVCAGPRGTPLVLVTHHVEEIASFITHALVLREGRIVAAGPKDEVLTNATLSHAFAADCELRVRGGRYDLRVTGARPT